MIREVTGCRVCKGNLYAIADLGEQCLGGQFPAANDPDPPKYPLVLTECGTCHLVQLGHTVDPALMFTDYWYRSGLTDTMSHHLRSLAVMTCDLLERQPKTALDIGCNTGTLLKYLPDYVSKTGIDPSNAAFSGTFAALQIADRMIRGTYPSPELTGHAFDLIFSIACLYDVDDPLAFVLAIRKNLADGIWCCEVADAIAMHAGAWDGICHEHLCYYDDNTFRSLLEGTGLSIKGAWLNGINGGSLGFWITDNLRRMRTRKRVPIRPDWSSFAETVKKSTLAIINYLYDAYRARKKVHLLGASTKANTWLQYCGVEPELIQYASDRDQRKVGCKTPGTNIPIISEMQSREMEPDVYIVGPWHFRNEIILREQAFLDRGGQLVFPLPKLEVIRR